MTFTPLVRIPDEILARNDARPWWFLFYKDQLLIQKKGREIEIPRCASPGELDLEVTRPIHLGTLDDIPCFAGEIPDHGPLPRGMKFRDMRMLLGSMTPEIAGAAGLGAQLTAWDRNHRFCGKCGTETKPAENERSRRCENCGHEQYPRITPAVIVAVTRNDESTGGENRLLLATGGRLPEGLYSVIAGFVEPGESPEECVEREVLEETGIRVRDVRYFGSQPWPFPHTLMLAFTARYESGEITVDGEEIRHADWYRTGEMPRRPDGISISGRLIEWFDAGADPLIGDPSPRGNSA